jgi:hypothetical protein
VTGGPWLLQHHWAAAALEFAQQNVHEPPWLRRIVAIVDPNALNPADAAEVAEVLATMQDPVDADTPTWVGGPLTVSAADLPSGSGAPSEPVVLVAGPPSTADLSTLVIGFHARQPVLGLVALERGYVISADVRQSGSDPETGRIWSPGGSRWPADVSVEEGQPAVAAFAHAVGSTDSAMLAYRVPGTGQRLSAAETATVVDLDRAGKLAFTSMSSPLMVLALACGQAIPIASEVRAQLFRPAWLVGRSWLHQILEQLFAATTAIATATAAEPDRPEAPAPVAVEVAEPPLELAKSWRAVREDQQGPRQLGRLLADDEARLLPELLLIEQCLRRTPTQEWLWETIGGLCANHDGGDQLLVEARKAWERWPRLHEPDTFFARSASARS